MNMVSGRFGYLGNVYNDTALRYGCSYERGVFSCPPVGPPLSKLRRSDQVDSHSAVRRTHPCFLTFLVSLKDMDALRPLVIVFLQTVHRSLGRSFAGTTNGGLLFPGRRVWQDASSL